MSHRVPPLATRPGASPRTTGPKQFVGRARELDVADDLVQAAVAGRGSVLVLGGEAGIGKSRLAHEIAELARGRGMQVVSSAGWSGGGAPAYWPWPEILTSVAGPAGAALDLGPGPAPAESERFERFRAVCDVLRQQAAHQPLVVVLDDAHAVDADGLLLTRFVARGIADHPVLLLVAHRTTPDVPSFAAGLLGEISRDGVVLRLQGLQPDEIRDFAAASGEDTPALALARLHELTGGNPFLVEQVLEAGLHHGDRLVPDAALRLLDPQLDGLAAAAYAVLEAAAVLGTAATLPELAAVVDTDQLAVERAGTTAAQAGLVRAGRSLPFAFTHDLAREAVLARTSPERLAELHARCLAVLGSDDRSPERAVRRARHGLALARCSVEGTTSGVEVARSSARILLSNNAPEAAVEILREALTVYETIAPGATATLVTELGSAMLATGRLADARALFRRAVSEAEAAGDATTYARAALGLGGVWLREHRTVEDDRAYHAIVRRAIDGIANDPSPPATRMSAALRLRQAAELVAVGAGSLDDARAALERVRELGDPHDLAAGLSLLHHAMLGPEHADERLAVATELLDVARACGDELQSVVGLLWRTVDSILVGHEADRGLSELRERADALGMRAILFIADVVDVMRLMRAGELDAAETAAATCLERGIEVGDADASVYYGAQILALRWYAGRADELLELATELTVSTAVPSESQVFVAVVAALAAEAGDLDRAEQALAMIGRGRLHEIAHTSVWMTTMFVLTEAATQLQDTDLAAELYDLLEPYAALPIMAGIGSCCFGSAERVLGLTARVVGRVDDAVAHLERAELENQRLGNRPLTAITRAELAETLIDRNGPDDRTRAALLVARAIEAGTDMGLDGRLPAWTDLQTRIATTEVPPAPATCTRRGGDWVLEALGERVEVRHTVGMGYLASLLASPRVGIGAADLAGVGIVSPPQAVLDPAALVSLRRRMDEIDDELDAATVEGRVDDAERLQRELDGILSHARVATSLGGRSRAFDDSNERARTSVQKALRRAIANIGDGAPRIGRALEGSVRTGYRCVYEPGSGAPDRWDVRPG